MAAQEIRLTAAHDAFIADLIAAGEYRCASEVICDALRALQQRRREDTWKRTVLQARIASGILGLDGAELRADES